MQLISKFEVPAPLDETWALLGDIPRIAPCLPGATVRPLSDEVFEGDVAIKVGPIRAAYTGQATMTRKDEGEHVMVLDAQGREGGGKGSASAIITLRLRESGASSTSAEVVTDLTITGRLAQFGRSAMADVSQRLMDQFASNLAELVAGGRAAASGPGGSASHAAASDQPASDSRPGGAERASGEARPGPSATSDNELDAMTLLVPMLRQAVAPGAAALVGLALGALLGGRRRARRSRLVQPYPAAPWTPSLARPWPGCSH